jgi:hypothetical protein
MQPNTSQSQKATTSPLSRVKQLEDELAREKIFRQEVVNKLIAQDYEEQAAHYEKLATHRNISVNSTHEYRILQRFLAQRAQQLRAKKII